MAPPMNSDESQFFEVCKLFEELGSLTLPATSKRTNLESDTGSLYYLTKETKIRVYQIISKWFTKFNSGSLLSIFRLLVPEVHLTIQNCCFILLRRILEGFTT